jgi:hypothetical protein
MTIVCRASLLGVALCSLVSTQVLSYNRDPVYKSVVFWVFRVSGGWFHRVNMVEVG